VRGRLLPAVWHVGAEASCGCGAGAGRPESGSRSGCGAKANGWAGLGQAPVRPRTGGVVPPEDFSIPGVRGARGSAGTP